MALEGLSLAPDPEPKAEVLEATVDQPQAQPEAVVLQVEAHPNLQVVERLHSVLESADRQPTTPMTLLGMAMDQGADLDRLERLMAMQERWEEKEALKAYNRAFAAFKSEAVKIIKNIDVKDGPLKGKKYADLFAVVDSATPALSRNGLSAAWKLTKDEKDWVEVTCILRHELGHFETVTMGGPPDVGGAKNAIQARASTVSYLERYTFLAITGLASSDGDKDGSTIPTGEVANDCVYLATAPTMGDLLGRFKEVYPRAGKDQVAQKALMKAKDDRKLELEKPKEGAL